MSGHMADNILSQGKFRLPIKESVLAVLTLLLIAGLGGIFMFGDGAAISRSLYPLFMGGTLLTVLATLALLAGGYALGSEALLDVGWTLWGVVAVMALGAVGTYALVVVFSPEFMAELTALTENSTPAGSIAKNTSGTARSIGQLHNLSVQEQQWAQRDGTLPPLPPSRPANNSTSAPPSPSG